MKLDITSPVPESVTNAQLMNWAFCFTRYEVKDGKYISLCYHGTTLFSGRSEAIRDELENYHYRHDPFTRQPKAPDRPEWALARACFGDSDSGCCVEEREEEKRMHIIATAWRTGVPSLCP